MSSCAEGGSERLTVADSSVQLLSVGSQQVVTPTGLSITVVATVEPPRVSSTKLQANSFWLDGNSAYVAYNNAGLPVAGAIDSVDLTMPSVPRLVSEVDFPTQKINGLAVSHGWLYYTGASSDLGGAVVGRIQVSTGGQLGAASEPTRLSSYAGTGIAAHGDALYATSGDTGGLTPFNASLTLGSTASLADARGVAVSPDGRTVGVVSGQPGAVALFDSSGAPTGSYTLGGATVPESKSTIQIGNRLILASLGDGGFELVCSQDGAVLATQPAVVIPGKSTALTVTNAVSAGAGLVFAANGVAGVYVYRLALGAPHANTNCTADTLSLLGYLDLGDFSANNVYFSNNYLFVADGLGGFRILTIQNAMTTGTPDNDFVSPGTGVVVLNPTADKTLNMTGNASLSVRTGVVYVNSSSTKALEATGNAKLIADTSFIVGHDDLSGNASITGSIVFGTSPLSDPLSWLPVVASTGLPVAGTAAVSVSGNSTQVLSPGVYQNGISLSGNAQVKMNPGVYYLSEGGLSVSGNSSLSGQGVLIYNASTKAGINLTGNGSLTLTPMTSGTYAGITMFQNRSSTAPVTISGNGLMNVHGALYMASAPLTLSGNAMLPTLGSLDVADTITVSGNGAVLVSQ